MSANPTPLMFPMDGVTEQAPYAGEPKLAVVRPDLVQNVRPFDTLEDRQRGGQRPGSDKYFAAQINGTNDIQELNSAVQALDPSTVIPETTLFDSDFTSLAVGPLTTSDSANFDTDRCSGTSGDTAYNMQYEAADTSKDCEVETIASAGKVVVASKTTNNNHGSSAWIHSDHAIGSVFIITLWLRFHDDVSIPLFKPQIMIRLDAGDPGGTDYLSFELARQGSDPLNAAQDYKVTVGSDHASGAAYTAGILLTTADFTIDEGSGPDYTDPIKFEVQANGDAFVIRVNDNEVGSFGSVLYAGRTRAAIGVSRLVGLADHIVASRCKVETALPSASFRTVKSVIVAGGSVYSGLPGVQPSQAPGGSAVLRTSGVVQSQEAFQNVFFVDGFKDNYSYLDLSSGDVKDWATDVTAGTLPQGTVNTTQGCRILALYRGRPVMAGLPEDPHNWFMGRSGDAFDWDYSPPTTDALMPVAGNNADAGKLEDIISALIPYQDDLLFMGGDHSFWVMRGDPAAGGQIDNVSRQIGIVGSLAYAWDPFGTLFWMAQNGLYRFSPNSAQPELVSKGRLDKTFGNINLAVSNVLLSYDRDAQGLHIYISPVTEPASASRHWFWDARTDSFWPDEFPIVLGPTALHVYDADDPDDRAMWLGGYDGYVRFMDKTALNDDTTAIDSFFSFPIFHPGSPTRQFQLNECLVNTDADGGASTALSIFRGHTPEEVAVETIAIFTKTLAAGRNLPIPKRIRGNALRFMLRNQAAGETWAYENGSAKFVSAGRMRAGL